MIELNIKHYSQTIQNFEYSHIARAKEPAGKEIRLGWPLAQLWCNFGQSNNFGTAWSKKSHLYQNGAIGAAVPPLYVCCSLIQIHTQVCAEN